MNRSIGVYKLGLAAIGIFTLVLFIMVSVQASATKADNETYKKASSAADKINNYVTNKQKVPADLETAGVNNAPDSITYTKNSSSSYTFCVTYKTKSNGFDPSYVTSGLTSAALGGGVSDGTSTPYSSKTTLYIDSIHNKGKSCQTIKPSFYDFSSGSTCKLGSEYTQAAYDAYYKCLDSAYPPTSSYDYSSP